MQLTLVSSQARLVVIEDSDLIIKGLQRNIKNSHPTLATIFLKIKELENIFDKVSYYHVYRTQKSLADSLAKVVKQLEHNHLKFNEESKYELIP
jgi:hypothetical protein